jgi:hypothetical protein
MTALPSNSTSEFVANTVDGDWYFLLHPHDLGRQRAEEWLALNYNQLAAESTIDLQTKYLWSFAGQKDEIMYDPDDRLEGADVRSLFLFLP